MHESSAVASRHSRRMAIASVSTGFHTMRTEIPESASRARAMLVDCPATWRRVSSPYMAWLPVTNQTSRALGMLIV
jgi:hypothetical protein